MRRIRRLVRFPSWLGLAAAGLLIVPHVHAWGGLPHQQIVDGALTAIPATDHLPLRFGDETRHLRDTVEMGDWMNSLIVVQENWHVTTEDYPQTSAEYFGNDYLLFPAAPHFFSHIMPQVHETYGPYFLRALQALRTEDNANAVRWIGSLLHFVTDSGSPPHAIGLKGPNHTKMENWLDASHIDLRDYQPQLLGRDDAEAVAGLERRMDGLIARNGAIARQMLPYAEANDRARVEPLALDCAEETARVTADVLHTLLVLSAPQAASEGTSLLATVSAPALAEHPFLPAKLILLGTNDSTLSTAEFVVSGQYSGDFHFRNLAPGTYRAAIERPGATTLFRTLTLASGQANTFSWRLAPSSPAGNLVQNADFSLHWLSPTAPDHWHLDAGCHCWLSDNIPVTRGASYRASFLVQGKAEPTVTLEWMAMHWKRTDDAPIPIAAAGDASQDPGSMTTVTAPPAAVYARFSVSGDQPPQDALRTVALIPVSNNPQAPRPH
jgi:hypothetical protein